MVEQPPGNWLSQAWLPCTPLLELELHYTTLMKRQKNIFLETDDTFVFQTKLFS